MEESSTTSTDDGKIVCPECGAIYDKLPAYTCPRCGSRLCQTGCDGCKKSCALAHKP